MLRPEYDVSVKLYDTMIKNQSYYYCYYPNKFVLHKFTYIYESCKVSRTTCFLQ